MDASQRGKTVTNPWAKTGLLLSLCSLWPLAIAFCWLGLNRADKLGGLGRPAARAGFLVSTISSVPFLLLVLVFWLGFFSTNDGGNLAGILGLVLSTIGLLPFFFIALLFSIYNFGAPFEPVWLVVVFGIALPLLAAAVIVYQFVLKRSQPVPRPVPRQQPPAQAPNPLPPAQNPQPNQHRQPPHLWGLLTSVLNW